MLAWAIIVLFIHVYRKVSFDLPKGHTSMTYRSFKHFKRSVFRTYISNHNWDFLSSWKDPNELWSEWNSNFLAIADKNAPIRTKRVRSHKSPWITGDLKKLMHGRDIMKKLLTIKTNIIIRCKCFFLFIGREPTTWPANNCIQIMVCSCAMSFKCFWLQILLIIIDLLATDKSRYFAQPPHDWACFKNA